MPAERQLLDTIEAVHAAGLDAATWPRALASVARLFDANAATLERFERPTKIPCEFHAFGIPPASQLDYFDHYAALSPRAAWAFAHPEVDLIWDYRVLDERAMDRDPYYAGLLPQTDLRYFLSGQVLENRHNQACLSIQRTRRQGHVQTAEIDLMRRLLPHFRQAFDMSMRLRRAAIAGRSLEETLDWLADGVALLATDGAVVHANAALRQIARANDGIRVAKGVLECRAPQGQARLVAALALATRVGRHSGSGKAGDDFALARSSNLPAYLISVRPLTRGEGHVAADARAVALVFIRDPLRRHTAGTGILRDLFGLTDAEANLAQALQAGIAPGDYARLRAVSLNTVYTHLRRIKEKTGCRRMAALVRRLNELPMPLRDD